ncbi:MAG TPA: hypothetical protein VMV18_13525, partial [bacterium]|nr:hypothetical protein [bacterium]
FDAKQLTTDGGFDPAPSPNGKYLAYTARVGGVARLRIRRLEDGASLDITRGEALDGFPAWSHDAKSLFFVRYAYDTNEDGKVDVNDRPQIWQIPFDAERAFASPKEYVEARPWPVTPSGAYDLFPHVAGGKLFYSSDNGTNSDIFSIPEAGIFPALASGEDELALADALSAEPALRLLLLDQIAARRAPDSAAAQDATIAAARLRSDRRELAAAKSQIEALLADSRLAGSRRARAQVLKLRVAALVAAKSGPGGTPDKAALRHTADELESLAAGFVSSGAGATTSAMKGAKAEALLEAGYARSTAGDLLPATEDWQRAVKEGDGWPRAEAWLEAARAYAGLGQADRSVATFIAALKEYPDLIVPAERRAAAERERATMVSRIDTAIAAAAASAAHTRGIDLAQLPDVGVPETYGERAAEGVAEAAILGAQDARTGAVDPSAAIGALRDLASRNRDLPVLPSLAHNEIGDLYVRLGDSASAAMEFASVSTGNADPRQAQRARLSAAKALLVEGRYEEAVKALGVPPPADIPAGPKGVLARRARKAYVKTLLARADEEFRGHDYALARKSYRAVLAVDAREVRAHRGLIACYAALGEADRVSKIYEDEAEKTPDDPLIRYGVGLAWSYRTPEEKWMPKSEEELKKAVFLDDAQVFPHQTLGFVFEKEEELLGEKNGYERAADQYLLALSLNDANEDFRNAADLELNVGNAFFGLENYRKAYDYYARREKRDVPFDVKGRELVYRERFAKCAFESNRFEEAVTRYDTALAFLDSLNDKDLPAKSRAEHRARLLDERAFTIDQSQRAPSDAAAAYLDAAKANSIAGNEQNSAKSLRNAAIQLFEKGTGQSDYGATVGTAGVMVDKAALVDALDYLGTSLEGVEKRGALLHKAPPKKRHGLFHYNMNFSMSTDASEAVEGFDTKGEKELIYTFLGRIYESLDDAQRARDYYEKKKALLPAKVPAWQQQSLDYKRALLDNQIGVLAWETGDVSSAWTSLEASYKRAISIGDVRGGMTNAADLALIAVDLHDTEHREKALAMLDDALSLLEHTGTPDPERYITTLHGARAELLLQRAA